MQIHLFDCKSTNPLRRGLGKNKLNLCMLVLSQLRETYWSASVIYRLFERAQAMLEKSKSSSSVPAQARQATSTSHSGEVPFNSSSNGVNNQHQHRQQHQQHHQNTDDSESAMPQANLLMDGQMMQMVQGSFWLNESGSPCFSNVDQLLSPGFYIPENTFQTFMTGYDNSDGMGDSYDQILPTPNGGHLDLLYNV